jgi:hypothetical protein
MKTQLRAHVEVVTSEEVIYNDYGMHVTMISIIVLLV